MPPHVVRAKALKFQPPPAPELAVVARSRRATRPVARASLIWARFAAADVNLKVPQYEPPVPHVCNR
eukprot:3414645-Pyramimonas_sp.AAC.1